MEQHQDTLIENNTFKNKTLNFENETIEDLYLKENMKSLLVASAGTFLFLAYFVTMLVIIFKQHNDHLVPEHILTLNILVDIILKQFNYFILQILSPILSGPSLDVLKMISRFLSLTTGIWFYLDVIAQDLNAVLFVAMDAYYHERVTNFGAIVTIVGIKFLGAIIVSLTSLAFPPHSTFYLFNFFFTPEAFYLSCIPYFISFLNSNVVIAYMTITRYRLSKPTAPQNNITLQHSSNPTHPTQMRKERSKSQKQE